MATALNHHPGSWSTRSSPIGMHPPTPTLSDSKRSTSASETKEVDEFPSIPRSPSLEGENTTTKRNFARMATTTTTRVEESNHHINNSSNKRAPVNVDKTQPPLGHSNKTNGSGNSTSNSSKTQRYVATIRGTHPTLEHRGGRGGGEKGKVPPSSSSGSQQPQHPHHSYHHHNHPHHHHHLHHQWWSQHYHHYHQHQQKHASSSNSHPTPSTQSYPNYPSASHPSSKVKSNIANNNNSSSKTAQADLPSQHHAPPRPITNNSTLTTAKSVAYAAASSDVRAPPLPSTAVRMIIKSLDARDICCSEGGIQNHPLHNARFLQLVAANKDLYHQSFKSTDKSCLVCQMVDLVTQSGGRFLTRKTASSTTSTTGREKDDEDDGWYEIELEQSLDETSVVLRLQSVEDKDKADSNNKTPEASSQQGSTGANDQHKTEHSTSPKMIVPEQLLQFYRPKKTATAPGVAARTTSTSTKPASSSSTTSAGYHDHRNHGSYPPSHPSYPYPPYYYYHPWYYHHHPYYQHSSPYPAHDSAKRPEDSHKTQGDNQHLEAGAPPHQNLEQQSSSSSSPKHPKRPRLNDTTTSNGVSNAVASPQHPASMNPSVLPRDAGRSETTPSSSSSHPMINTLIPKNFHQYYPPPLSGPSAPSRVATHPAHSIPATSSKSFVAEQKQQTTARCANSHSLNGKSPSPAKKAPKVGATKSKPGVSVIARNSSTGETTQGDDKEKAAIKSEQSVASSKDVGPNGHKQAYVNDQQSLHCPNTTQISAIGSRPEIGYKRIVTNSDEQEIYSSVNCFESQGDGREERQVQCLQSSYESSPERRSPTSQPFRYDLLSRYDHNHVKESEMRMSAIVSDSGSSSDDPSSMQDDEKNKVEETAAINQSSPSMDHHQNQLHHQDDTNHGLAALSAAAFMRLCDPSITTNTEPTPPRHQHSTPKQTILF